MRRAARRAAAALVALILSGLPRVLPAALAAGGEHRCQCASHGARHVCACPVCRARAREARRDATKALPPCHRDAALAGLEEDERAERLPAACLRPSCGGDPARAAGPPAQDVFAVPHPPALARRELGSELALATPAAGDRAPEPALPPPRAA